MLLKEPFIWTPAAEAAYNGIKDLLISSQIRMPYDSTLPLLLATDASKVGLGVVLSHRLSNGKERSIPYASRTLSNTEQKYSDRQRGISHSFGYTQILSLCVRPTFHINYGS